MTPSYSGSLLGGGIISREASEVFPVPNVENPEAEPKKTGAEENPEAEADGVSDIDLIQSLSLKNLFTPKFFSWGDTASPMPATPQSLASSEAASTDVPPKVAPSAAVTDAMSDIAKYGATKPVIHNVVATASLGCELDLKQIAMTARNAEYNPRRFAAVIMRIREPKSTALVFKSGKLVVTGTKSEGEARHAARKFGRVIMKVGYKQARFKDFRVENLVSTFNVPFPIHLEELYKNLPSNMHSQYEPEVFPGLITRVPGGTLLIFVSGKCVMIGMKTKENIEEAYSYILPKLGKYRKK